MGTEVIASINIVSTVKKLAIVLFIGIANACLIMVGNKIGANNEEVAFKYAGKFLRISMVLGLLLGLIIITAKIFGKIDKVARNLMIPYIIWVAFATILNISIWSMNM